MTILDFEKFILGYKERFPATRIGRIGKVLEKYTLTLRLLVSVILNTFTHYRITNAQFTTHVC